MYSAEEMTLAVLFTLIALCGVWLAYKAFSDE